MNAKELVGKKAIRTTYTTYAHGTINRSFMEEPIIIQKATDTHIVYTYPEEDICASDKLHVLSYEYCDDSWIDYDELVSGIEISESSDVLAEFREYVKNNRLERINKLDSCLSKYGKTVFKDKGETKSVEEVIYTLVETFNEIKEDKEKNELCKVFKETINL